MSLSEDEPVLRKLRNSFLKSDSLPYITNYDSLAIKYCLHPEFWCFNAINEDGTTSIINDDIFRLIRLDASFSRRGRILHGKATFVDISQTTHSHLKGQSDLSGRHPHVSDPKFPHRVNLNTSVAILLY